MRADSILRRVLRSVTTEIHGARLNAVSAAVLALIHGGQVGLSALGRAIALRSQKHGIKRVDRLLGNQALGDELEMIYGAIARYVLRDVKRPVILLDWTDTAKKKTMCTLSAAVPVQGRAITIYSVTCPYSQYTSPSIENRFLETLQALLGPGCTPILVADAGFRGTWMRRVLARGWDFLTRIRGRTQVQHVDGNRWEHWKNLFPLARRVPRLLGSYRLVRSDSIEVQLVAVDQRSKRARLRSSPIKRRNLRALRASRSQREPWVLATSLTVSAQQIVSIYRARMQIELTFRDLKSHRFGWGFGDARCRSTPRIAIQILIAALASLVAMLVGIAAETAGLHKSFQANTIKTRRVLSWVTLGRELIRTGQPLELPLVNLREHLPFVGIP